MEAINVPLANRYFHPKGYFGGLRATYVRQTVRRPNCEIQACGIDDFVVVDAVIGYRLPNRMGIVSIEGRNLFDNEFRFQDDGFREFPATQSQFGTAVSSVSPYIPARTILARISLNF